MCAAAQGEGNEKEAYWELPKGFLAAEGNSQEEALAQQPFVLPLHPDLLHSLRARTPCSARLLATSSAPSRAPLSNLPRGGWEQALHNQQGI